MINRDQERIVSNYTNREDADTLFLKFSSDFGTILNMGRRGSKYAPEAILNIVKKLASHNLKTWSEIEIINSNAKIENFKNDQNLSIKKLSEILFNYKEKESYIYLGGGHDHIYPLLMALNQKHKHIVVINIDAHLDTRIDESPNSGTPFRQFSKDSLGKFELIQLGIHDFSNSISTMSNLHNAAEKVACYEDVRFGTKDFTDNLGFLKKIIPFDQDAVYVFSLDADALSSSIMEAVSAVNHRGLPYDFVEDVILYAVDELKCKHFGFYEYNPVYDNLSQKGARTLAALIYQVLDDRNFNE